MSLLSQYVDSISPKMSKEMMTGICYVRLNSAIDYIDNFIRYSCHDKTNTNLKYLGYEELTPRDEIKFLFGKKQRAIHDIAENDMYLVKFLFQYGDEPAPREYFFYLPYLHKGNILRLSGNRFLVMPTLADKVVSIGDRVIFINILTAKYNFIRTQHTVTVNGSYQPVPVIVSELYKNQVKKYTDTTKALSTVIHYLLSNYGYTKTMKTLLGYVPRVVYDCPESEGTVIETTGLAPKGYVGDKALYKKTNIKFVLEGKDVDKHALYCVGNVMYVLDNFPDRITIDQMDNPHMWQRLMGEIIHSGNCGLGYLTEKMLAHFKDLNSKFDVITTRKLRDVDVDATTLMQLLVSIFQNFNTWILHSDSRSVYGSKSYEVESFVLSNLTSRITRTLLDINKEELRIDGVALDRNTVDKIFKKYFTTRAIFSLRKEKMYVTSIDYSGDHLYFKNTSMVVKQESDFVNTSNPESNTSERAKLTASMATVGSILGLSKKNPIPLIRLNPYVNVCAATGTTLPHPEYDDIIRATDLLLANMGENEDVPDIDELDIELELDDEVDDEFELDTDFESDNWDI